jgi:type IV pilus assembly protein PilA
MESIRDRSRSEGGFTLIELLVVMIIISILMAVAVPTFLAQKNNAQKTKATGNIKQIVTAIESCAVNNTDGGYTGCTADGSLKAFEKGLTSLGAFTAAAPAADNAYQVVPLGTAGAALAPDAQAQGYLVQTRIKDGSKTIYFAEIHLEDGTLYKLCGTAAFTGASTVGAPDAASKTCPVGGANAGKW